MKFENIYDGFLGLHGFVERTWTLGKECDVEFEEAVATYVARSNSIPTAHHLIPVHGTWF